MLVAYFHIVNIHPIADLYSKCVFCSQMFLIFICPIKKQKEEPETILFFLHCGAIFCNENSSMRNAVFQLN